MSVLIITSTVNVNSCLTVIVDPEVRLNQYIDSICFYLNSKKIDKIIVCDNSGFDYSKIEIIKEFVISQKKKIEFLFFMGSTEKIQEYGKGYGEGEIMSHVFKNSKLIKEDEISFLKITGRLKLLNLDSLVSFFKSNNNYFQPVSFNPFKKINKIDTRFYQCDKLVFNEFLEDCYQLVNDNKGVYLEHVYYNILSTEKIKFRNFNILPYFIGISGSTGLSYKISNFKFIRNYFIFGFHKFLKLF